MEKTLKINLEEKHSISPYLYMQFMEPLGVCDTSVDAAWNFKQDKWHDKVIDKTKELAPTMLRYGGCFASYYHWKEAVGPQSQRVPMYNYVWGGYYQNQVGTHEFIDFCRQVGAEPLLQVNMQGEGLSFYNKPWKDGSIRAGTVEEAAEWVDYCNNPDNALRISHGVKDPYNVKFWQIGNETSYSIEGEIGFTGEQCADVTRKFARKMKETDPSIKTIGWGDIIMNWQNPDHKDDTWCEKMSKVDEVDMIAFHHHANSGLPDSPLSGNDFRKDWENTWKHFMHSHKSLEATIARMRAGRGDKRLAMTEGHFTFPGKNRGSALMTWAAGVAYARWHNVIMRNSDVLDIATLADFCGNIWQSNALMIPTPIHAGQCYLMPVAEVMALYGRHQGQKAVDVVCDGAVDVVASRTGNKIFLHLANTDMNAPQQLKLDLGGAKAAGIVMEAINAHADDEITPINLDVFKSETTTVEGDTIVLQPCAVAAVEITLA